MNIGGRIVPEMEELSVSFNSSTFMFGVDVVIRYEIIYVLYIRRGEEHPYNPLWAYCNT